jgi:hypothetical protein
MIVFQDQLHQFAVSENWKKDLDENGGCRKRTSNVPSGPPASMYFPDTNLFISGLFLVMISTARAKSPTYTGWKRDVPPPNTGKKGKN